MRKDHVLNSKPRRPYKTRSGFYMSNVTGFSYVRESKRIYTGLIIVFAQLLFRLFYRSTWLEAPSVKKYEYYICKEQAETIAGARVPTRILNNTE